MILHRRSASPRQRHDSWSRVQTGIGRKPLIKMSEPPVMDQTLGRARSSGRLIQLGAPFGPLKAFWRRVGAIPTSEGARVWTR